MYASVYVRLVDRKERTRSVDDMSAVLRERLRAGARHHRHPRRPARPGGRAKADCSFRCRAPTWASWTRLTALALEKIRPIPGLVDLDSSVKPDKPTLDVEVRRDVASDLGLSVAQIGSALRTLVAGQTVGNWRAPDDQTYDVNVRLSPAVAQPAAGPGAPAVHRGQPTPTAAPRVVRLNQVASVMESTGPNQINRRDLTREVAINANVSGRSAGEVSADIKTAMDSIAMPPGYRYKFSGSTKNMAESFGYAMSALALA